MSQPKYTPGPWDKVIHQDGNSRVGAKTLIAIVYSEAFRDRENQKANALLIAAAPDLLAFVIRQRDATLCICHLNKLGGTDVPCTHCEVEALIAKTEGK